MTDWVADGIAGAGVLIAAVSFEASRRASNRADEAGASADSMAESLRRIADLQEAAVQRRQTEPRAERWTEADSGGPKVTEFALQPPRGPVFNVEYRGGVLFALRNVSTTPATAVTIDPESFPFTMGRNLPDRVTLYPMQSHEFQVFSASGAPRPGEVLVSCDEWSEPRHVPMPPTR